MENSKESNVSTAKQIAVVILLGAVGSGVWSLLGEPLIQVTGSNSVRLMGWLSSTYLESIYEDIGKGLQERSASLLYSSFSGIFVGFWLAVPFEIHSRWKRLTTKVSLLKAKIKAVEENDTAILLVDEESPVEVIGEALRFARNLKILFWALVVFAPLSIAFQLTGLYRSAYTSTAVVYLERSIEILAPHVGSSEHLRLRAAYRSVASREQFLQLHQQLTNYAKTQNVVLPAFSPL